MGVSGLGTLGPQSELPGLSGGGWGTAFTGPGTGYRPEPLSVAPGLETSEIQNEQRVMGEEILEEGRGTALGQAGTGYRPVSSPDPSSEAEVVRSVGAEVLTLSGSSGGANSVATPPGPGRPVSRSRGGPRPASSDNETDHSETSEAWDASRSFPRFCCFRLSVHSRCSQRAYYLVPVSDPVRVAGHDGLDQRGSWWCAPHATGVLALVNRGPLASRRGESWVYAMQASQ